MSRVRSFVLFWWDFVVGDDPLIAAGVVVMLGLCALLAHVGISAWWLPPLTVAGVILMSAARAQPRR